MQRYCIYALYCVLYLLHAIFPFPAAAADDDDDEDDDDDDDDANSTCTGLLRTSNKATWSPTASM